MKFFKTRNVGLYLALVFACTQDAYRYSVYQKRSGGRFQADQGCAGMAYRSSSSPVSGYRMIRPSS